MAHAVNLSALRAEAKKLRDRADAIDRHADAIDEHMRALAELSSDIAPVVQPVVAPATDARKTVRQGKKGGKPPGTMSMKWRGYFADICTAKGPQFQLNDVIAVVDMAEDRKMRPTEVRRLFKGHVEHGYLAALNETDYVMTEKLVRLLDEYMKSEGPPAATEGPYSGGVAERSIASDSKSDGVPLHSTPVGSNPTASAPSPEKPADMWASLSLTDQPNR